MKRKERAPAGVDVLAQNYRRLEEARHYRNRSVRNYAVGLTVCTAAVAVTLVTGDSVFAKCGGAGAVLWTITAGIPVYEGTAQVSECRKDLDDMIQMNAPVPKPEIQDAVPDTSTTQPSYEHLFLKLSGVLPPSNV